MKLFPLSTTRARIALAAITLLLIALIWHQNRKGEGNQPSIITSKPSSSAAESPRNSTSDTRASTIEADRLLKSEGARTDVTVSYFPEKEYLRLPPPNGKPEGAPEGAAFIHVPSVSRRVALEPNQLGEFPTVETGLKDTVGVRLQLDAVKPGTPVRIVILDGGTFPAAEGVSQVLASTQWGGIAFEYITSANIGTHRVLVQAAGQKSRILDFNASAANGS
jgi:hypothetical protein